MEEQRYLISEASKITGTEAHVLRYWEDELDLKIPRNELGHRCYTEDHIRLFQEIQELKNKIRAEAAAAKAPVVKLNKRRNFCSESNKRQSTSRPFDGQFVLYV